MAKTTRYTQMQFMSEGLTFAIIYKDSFINAVVYIWHGMALEIEWV